MPAANNKKFKKKTKNKQKEIVYLLYIVFAILLLLLTILNLQKIRRSNDVLGANTANYKLALLREREYWDHFLAQHPTYYDGWKRLSEIEFLLRDRESAQRALDTAKRIDSNR